MMVFERKFIYSITIRAFIFFIALIPQFSFGMTMKDSLGTESEGDFYFNKGIDLYSVDIDSSILYLNKALNFFEESENDRMYLETINYLTSMYFMNGQFNKAETVNFRAFSFSPRDSVLFLSDLLTARVNFGILNIYRGKYIKGIHVLESILMHKKIENFQEIKNSILYNLGLAYLKVQDPEKSISFFKKSITALKDKNDTLSNSYSYALSGLAESYAKKANPLKAFDYFRRALDIKMYLYSDKSLSSSSVCSFAGVYLNFLVENGKNEEIENTIDLFKKNKLICKNYNFFEFKGRYYSSMENRNKSAFLNFKKAISIVELKFSNYKRKDPLSRQYYNLSTYYRKIGDYKNELKNINLALAKASFDKGFLKVPMSNPKVDSLLKTENVLNCILRKAQILQSKYKKSEDVEELKAALATYELALELAKRMRQDILSQGSKQKLAGDIFPVYEGGIEVALALFRLTGEEMYQEKAFRFAESNKSILLLESINESVAKSYSGIPDSLLDADKSLRTEIAFYEKSINEEKAQRDTTKIDYQKIKQWKNTLFDLKNEYQALIRVLEKDYPRYYELKYETKLATLKELQQNILSPTDAMLELFVGDRNIYVFAVTQNQVHIETISKPEDFEKQFEVFFYHTKNPQKSKKDRDPALALKGQYDFYADYLEGAMSTLPDGIKRLIIIPDDMFSFLPFEIFLSSPPQKMNKPRFSLEYHDYLIEQYSFTYNYSATLLQKSYAERKGPKAKHFLLAMAPRFLKNNQVASRDAERVCTINDIGNLGCTDEEIEQITDMVGGKALLDYDANMEAFNQIASEYKIIHLATHSCPDEENPMNSRIFLADGALTNYDLFNYKLSADMAVLSACNTGFGKFVKGEGVMPLSKGFIHAGVPSTIASTWPVEDCGTAEIMTLFYKYLKEGLAKDEALRQAKLQFMRESNNLFRQPYFWSPLIHVGNVEPIEVPYRTPTWVYWSAAGLLLLMGGTILWQRQRQTKLAA